MFGNLLKVLGAGGIVVVIIAFFLLAPFVGIWLINSWAEVVGSDLYVEHELWNYWLAFLTIALVRGGSGSKS